MLFAVSVRPICRHVKRVVVGLRLTYILPVVDVLHSSFERSHSALALTASACCSIILTNSFSPDIHDCIGISMRIFFGLLGLYIAFVSPSTGAVSRAMSHVYTFSVYSSHLSLGFTYGTHLVHCLRSHVV